MQKKEGKYKNIGVLSKKARGLFINYCIKNKVSNLDQIKKFDIDGYGFSHAETFNLVFVK